jgi:Fe-S cluster assembly ATPase SufC
MNQKYCSVNVWVLLVVSIGLILFTFILVTHNETMPNKINQDRDNLLSVGKIALEHIKPIAKLNLGS